MELAQSLDNVDVLARPSYHQLGTLMKTVIQDLERFQDVAPVLALIVETLVDHIHDLVELVRTKRRRHIRSCHAVGTKDHLPPESHGGDLGHVSARRAPGVIARGCMAKTVSMLR